MSDRYALVAALLDDPLNLVGVLRELVRRGAHPSFVRDLTLTLCSPAIPSDDGSSFVHVSISYLLRTVERPPSYDEVVAGAHRDPGGEWRVYVRGTHGDAETETGPFASADEAVAEMKIIITSAGISPLEGEAWDAEDEGNFAGIASTRTLSHTRSEEDF